MDTIFALESAEGFICNRNYSMSELHLKVPKEFPLSVFRPYQCSVFQFDEFHPSILFTQLSRYVFFFVQIYVTRCDSGGTAGIIQDQRGFFISFSNNIESKSM